MSSLCKFDKVLKLDRRKFTRS